MAGLRVERPVTGRYGSPDALRRGGERARRAADRLDDRPVAGIMGGPMFGDQVVSLDVPRGRLLVRPADSGRRRLHDREPIAASRFRTEQNVVWVPVTVDGTEGWANLDSGNFATWVDTEPGPAGTGRPDTLTVAGVDLMPHLTGAAFREVDRSGAYEGIPLDVIANLGVDALAGMVVTIDYPRERVYFERPGD